MKSTYDKFIEKLSPEDKADFDKGYKELVKEEETEAIKKLIEQLEKAAASYEDRKFCKVCKKDASKIGKYRFKIQGEIYCQNCLNLAPRSEPHGGLIMSGYLNEQHA